MYALFFWMAGTKLTSVKIDGDLVELAKEHGIKYSNALRVGMELLTGKRDLSQRYKEELKDLQTKVQFLEKKCSRLAGLLEEYCRQNEALRDKINEMSGGK